MMEPRALADSREKGDLVFLQVLRGHAVDEAGVKRQLDQWFQNLASGAEGWLGSTGGVTQDGRFIASFRFESEEAAQRNSDRKEQTQWWTEFSKYLDTPRFWDCNQVEEDRGGGSDEAGFVQVIMTRILDPDDFRRTVRSMAASTREDVIGSIRAWHGSQFSEFVYFTSEEEARKGERGAGQQAALEKVWPRTQDIEYFDLTSPWLVSP
jgi:hypothetical protein